MPPKKTKSPTPVVALKHKDKRANIPTKELRGFVAEDEKQPKAVLYPRDPSLDPQLVWRGKDEQDQKPLEVPAVPIYIQEKIQPQVIIEEVRAEAKKGAEQQAALFADFNGIKFEDLIDFYRHEQNWANRFILGDSLLVMTSLVEKEGLKGKVQCLYFDPPYGINFGSNWQVSTRKRDVKDGKAEDATRQPEQIRAFRDTWKLGIHSYLAYLRDRLTAARELLTESGSVFVQIGAENVHLVRNVLDEVFGSENFISLITFATTSGFESNEIPRAGDYILWYGKNKEAGTKYRGLHYEVQKEAGMGNYRWVQFPDGTFRALTAKELRGEDPFPEKGRLYSPDSITSSNPASEDQTFEFKGKKYSPGTNSHWKAKFPDGMRRLGIANRLHVSSNSIRYIRFADDFPFASFNNLWTDTLTGQFTDEKIYVVQTNVKVIGRCIQMTTDPGDLVLDPTCGSGTTAYVAEQWGRRWITIDTSRVAIALARTRLMAAKFPYYLLADSPEGVRKEAELTGKVVAAVADRGPRSPNAATEPDIKRGFIFKRVPHVTLKSIANNPDIKEGMKREEIDRAIAKHADTELLYDQPYEDNKRIRVTGPFTVESLSPHRVLSDEGRVASDEKQAEQSSFVTIILENLRKAGIQNTRKEERLKFDSIEPFAGVWIHAVGTVAGAEGDATRHSPPATRHSLRVAISIGPEHGTVSPEHVKEAAKEAVQGVGFDLLVVCGFAFDPHVSEEAKRFGKLQVLIARMNPDLAMGDELLKKTGAGNLFMVFGEPDMEVKTVAALAERGPRSATAATTPQLQVTIKGLDIYDPTTGQIRNNSTEDIACWFIDTNYNGESFFVRHAYFTGGNEPYERLKKSLRAEIDESAWQTLYSTTSRPFDPPKTGKIAVKVINHYGDEVLKVVELKN